MAQIPDNNYNKDMIDISRTIDCGQNCSSRNVCDGINCIELCDCLLLCNKNPRPENCLMRKIVNITKVSL
jgi:hypothetical protein